jgi:hypothetical protein
MRFHPIYEPILYQDNNSQLVFGHTEFMRRRDWRTLPAFTKVLYTGNEINEIVAVWRAKELKTIPTI